MAANPIIPPVHSERVKAWVYAVLNPVIQGLRTEQALLAEKNLTWRAYSGRCQYILPIQQYLDPFQLPNLEDFLVDPLNPDFKHDFEQHDAALHVVEAAADEFFRVLMKSSIFLKQVETSLREFTRNRTEAEVLAVKDLAKDVAEFLINNVQELPSHYIRQPFWQEHNQKFTRLISDSEAYTSRQSFQALQGAVEHLQRISQDLKSRLESHRRYLCTHFDIPAAPLETDSVPERS